MQRSLGRVLWRLANRSTSSCLMLEEPTNEEVKEIIERVLDGKVPGKDGINIKLAKYGGEGLLERACTKEYMERERNANGVEICQIHNKTA